MTKRKANSTIGNSIENFHKLSIQVSLNGLSFCTLDTISNIILNSDRLTFEKSLSPNELQENLKSLFEKHDLVNKKFSEVIVVHSNGLFSFVPKSLFDVNEMANYLKFNAKILANDHIAYDELENYDMVNVYVPFVNINNYIFDLFGEFEYKHNGTVLVQTLLNSTISIKEPTSYVYVSENQMDICILAQKKLLLYNSYIYNTKEDFIYYLLFTMEQLKLDTETTKLKLFGSIEEGDPIYRLCYQYVKNISIFKPSITSYPIEKSNQSPIDFTVLSVL
ncbi:MAG: DUF3822 family protein [Maribacter sp.]